MSILKLNEYNQFLNQHNIMHLSSPSQKVIGARQERLTHKKQSKPAVHFDYNTYSSAKVIDTKPLNIMKSKQPKERKHSRQPTIDSSIRKFQFMPVNSVEKLKSMLRGSIETEREVAGSDKITSSPLYKKLMEELQNMKKNYNCEILSLKSEVKELDEQIVTEKQNLLSLINKRNKMENDVKKYNDQLVDLQQKNYEMYWDVAARLNLDNQANDGYEDLLELGEQMGQVSRGLTEEQIDKVMKKCQKLTKKKKTKNTGNECESQVQSCCICCQNIVDNQETCCLPCGHNHHSSCIREWLLINKVCPLCRVQVSA